MRCFLFDGILMLLLSHRPSRAFVPTRPCVVTRSLSSSETRQRPNGMVLVSSNDDDDKDEYDDWYNDFDPSSFDTYVEPIQTTSSSYGNNRGGRGRGAGRRQHDYVRDIDADNSNVDVDTINALISERLQYRKTGQFDQADAIRDVLLEQHGVRVLDREKMWRSGCSRSGSGRQWVRQQKAIGGGGRRENNRKPRSFGPNGHDYELSIDAGPNLSQLTEEEIHARIAERLQHKMSRNFRDADAVQIDLENVGVYIHDGKKEWRADGEPYGAFQGGKQQPRGPGRTPNSANEWRDRPYTQSVASEETEFNEQIQSLIAERAEAKKTRAFDVADDIRDQLRQLYNVMVDDRRREWSVGGDFGAPVDNSRQPKPFTRRGGGSLSEQDLEKIAELLDKRDQAKSNRQFAKADSIRDNLRDTYTIRIDDRSREWHVVTNAYTMVPETPLNPQVKKMIEQKISERAVAKLNSDYETADAIRDELAEQYSVFIDDRVKEWSVASVHDAEGSFENGLFVNGDDDTTSEESDLQTEAEQALDSDYNDDGDGESVAAEDLSSLTVDMLKERLREAGLPVSGRKAELIERLSNNLH